MTLKEQLEILRGEPIKVFEGNPLDIPCIETSDAEKLCKHPVVSVNMITYNHEPYIRRAIEGVMMQQTDFEFELIIGEDASQDKTREICFEYQKKHPDKIRVLWSEENVYHLGGNSRRVMARCRGEFIALCEGDDYWTDPLKLQKQVDLIRKTNAVMCVADSEWHMPDGSIRQYVYSGTKTLLGLYDVLQCYFHTTTYLLDKNVYFKCQKKYPEFIYWYDCVMLTCMATMGTICYLPEIVSVYNWTGLGVAQSEDSPARVWLLVTQHLQFSYCSNRKISDKHYKILKYSLPRFYALYSSTGCVFSQMERSRMLSVLRNLIQEREGKMKAALMVVKCRLFVSVMCLFYHFPRIAHFCRQMKKMLRFRARGEL